ncbi:transporter substrate-binding domain-containing protein [Pseudoalteromonas sp. NEC-BIFX-2020_015]|uniref:transporter substrate-binding domain-containing protein n=1 Tax=Pseudoalteromonas sp. NEC-BIFX-2020_015 TaxID=2729544 RepID=UPI0014613AC9|nr:transporter substrate-binding domain-containing protein [Pseudoalteromonas sp. NEC-BIFX-2020_015]NMR25280.1 transporter substrate-binding domain-containing protein [Pseudoalteromonas sp. NEC-BIFX-2020_015]
MLKLVLVCLLFTFNVRSNTEQTVRFSAGSHPYPIELLKLALGKSEIKMLPEEIGSIPTQTRAIRLLGEKNGIDVFWGATSSTWEKQAKAILIPIDKGLLGYRIPLVNIKDKELFANVTHSGQLRTFLFGLREDWPDTAIFINNELHTQIYGQGADPIEMLKARRIDALPYDIFDLAQNYGDDIVHDKYIAIRYPSALYFFVANKDAILYEQIKSGLLAAIADGSFDELFNRYFAKTIELADLKNRRIIELVNPLLPLSAPIHQPHFWLDKKALTK